MSAAQITALAPALASGFFTNVITLTSVVSSPQLSAVLLAVKVKVTLPEAISAAEGVYVGSIKPALVSVPAVPEEVQMSSS